VAGVPATVHLRDEVDVGHLFSHGERRPGRVIERTRGISLDIDAVPLDDPHTYELLGRGDTIGVFQLESAPMRALLRALAPLHRTARNLHAALQEARTLVPDDRDLINLRDRAGEVERTVELLLGDARTGLDFTIAHQAEQQARRTHQMAVAAYRLNLLAAAFFPVAALGSVFGMNLAHGLDGWNNPAHFWGVLVVGLLAGLVLARMVAREPAAAPGRPARKVKTRANSQGRG